MTEALRISSVFFAFLLAAGVIFSLLFPAEIGEVIGRIKGVELTPTGVKISTVDKEKAKEQLREAVKKRNEGLPGEKIPPELTDSVVENSVGTGRILWVDDNPKNNEHERRALHYLGYQIDLATSNAEALLNFSLQKYSVVVSDIGRGDHEGGAAGLKLPAELRRVQLRLPPVIYYVFDVKAPLTDEGYPVLNRPDQLLKLISVATH